MTSESGSHGVTLKGLGFFFHFPGSLLVLKVASLDGKVACELSKHLYGVDQWWVLLKVRMGPGPTFPVGTEIPVIWTILTVRAVQIGAPHGGACGRWTNKKSDRFAPIGARLALYYSNFLRSTTLCITASNLSREVPHPDTCGQYRPVLPTFSGWEVRVRWSRRCVTQSVLNSPLKLASDGVIHLTRGHFLDSCHEETSEVRAGGSDS